MYRHGSCRSTRRASARGVLASLPPRERSECPLRIEPEPRTRTGPEPDDSELLGVLVDERPADAVPAGKALSIDQAMTLISFAKELGDSLGDGVDRGFVDH